MATQKARYLALLRGINVGGKNKLPMKDLAVIFQAAGCTGVSTFIQSGNVLFHCDPAKLKTLAARVSAAIELKFKMCIPVIVISYDELASAVKANPFVDDDPENKTLHVYF